MTTQKKCVEEQKETNSMHEENDVSNRHMAWWRDAWWVRVDNGPGRRRAWRAATRAAREARETSQEEEGRNGSKGQRREEKATPCTLSCTCMQIQVSQVERACYQGRVALPQREGFLDEVQVRQRAVRA